MDFANTVVRKDEANGYQMDDAHDAKAINEAAREFGLLDGETFNSMKTYFHMDLTMMNMKMNTNIWV